MNILHITDGDAIRNRLLTSSHLRKFENNNFSEVCGMLTAYPFTARSTSMTTQERDELTRLRKRLPELERKDIEAYTAPALAQWKETKAEKGWK